MFKTRVDPETGRMQTYDDETPSLKEGVDRMRRELREMLSGNTQFHDDPRAAKPKPPHDAVHGDYICGVEEIVGAE